FQAEDGIRDRNVTGVRRVLFRSRTAASTWGTTRPRTSLRTCRSGTRSWRSEPCAGPSVARERLDHREQDGLPDPESGERHEQAVDTHAETGRGRHALLHRGEEVLVEHHRLVVAGRGQARLVLETLTLDHRVHQLGAGGRPLESADVEVALLGDTTVGAVITGQRRGLDGEVADEDRALQLVGTQVLPQLLDELAVEPALPLGYLQADLRRQRGELVDGRVDRHRLRAAGGEFG